MTGTVSFSFVVLSLLLAMTLFVSTAQSSTTNSTAPYTISRDFANAVDFGIGKVVDDPEFRKGMIDLGMLFSPPTCSFLPYTRQAIPDAPLRINLPRLTPLILCYESDALLNWPKVHELAGRVLMRILSERYKRDIQYNFLKVDTSKLGYFNTLKSMVDNGECDIAIASTNLDNNRLSQVHFQCPYGSSSPGFLRSSLDNGTVIINSESDIDSENVTVLAYRGTSYDTYAKANYKKAKIISVPSGYTESFDMILNRQAHVLLGDATDLATWLTQNKDACGGSCFSRIFGEPFSFGSFLTNNIRESNSNIVSSGSFSITFLLLLLICITLL